MFLEKFNFKNKEIIFIGTNHGPEKEKINYLKKNILLLKPDLILIEGGFENATFKSEKESINKGWELGFVSFFAKKNKISLKGNDPSDEECINFIASKYSKDLAFLYFILRNLNMLLKQNPEQSNNDKIKIILEDFRKNSKWDYNFSWKKFLHLFEKEFKELFNINKDYTNYFNPNLNLSRFNYISKKLSLFRDNFIENKLTEYLQYNNKILIIKGGGHFENYKKLIKRILKKEC